MKILKLRLQNINSLVGEWEIDLTDPLYIFEGIFAITGPTGAGKSSILDAICLALYSATPRLGKITKSANDVMSRGTGECFVEVTFETTQGRFRCTWSQHRARRKAGGELQHARHQIVEADSGRIVEDKLKDVEARIEEITGMNFDRFRRSMLLAQGGFDAFLKATPDERAPILEQITGTEVYSRISMRVHERTAEEQKKLDDLQTEIGGITLLGETDLEELEHNLNEALSSESAIAERIAAADAALKWFSAIEAIENELRQTAVLHEDLRKRMDSFAPSEARLRRAEKTLSSVGDYSRLKELRSAQATDWKEYAGQERELTSCREEVLRAGRVHAAAAHALEEVVRSLSENRKAYSEAQQMLETIRINLEKKRRGYNDLLQGRSLAEYLDERIALSEKKLRLKRLTESTDALTSSQGRLRELERDVGRLTAEKRDLLEQLATGREKQEVLEKEVVLLERQCALLDRIASLEESRKQLKDGEPCPLCGSTTHPFAQGNVPDEGEARRQLEERRQVLKNLEATVIDMRLKLTKCEQGLDQTQLTAGEEKSRIASAASEINRLCAEFSLAADNPSLGEKLRYLLDETGRALDRTGQTIKAVQTAGKEVEMLQHSCEEARNALDAAADGVRTIDRRRELLQYDIDHLAADTHAIEAEIERMLSDLRSEVAGYGPELLTIEASDDVVETLAGRSDAWSSRLAETTGIEKSVPARESPVASGEAVDKAEKWCEDARLLLDTADNKAAELNGRMKMLSGRISRREEELAVGEATFLSRIDKAGFAGMDDYCAALLPEDEYAALQQQAHLLAEEKAGLEAREKDRKEALHREREKRITTASREEIEASLNGLTGTRSELQQRIGSIRQQLADNADRQRQYSEKMERVDYQKEVYGRWDRLHQLVGSADGKKFRNFAQGITFDHLIGHANRQLQKMTGRYLLIRNSEEPLSLDVIDQYQGGEVRSTKNLSGGESFVVSLSLALGLSQMSSRNVRVDSLFLDEGFGSLDEETLQTALETLAGLHQEGKLIGVISHVPGLRDRIAAQILVIPQTGGKSVISGPGCRRVR
ncbi:MAG: AAA family ATPase [Chitinispirillaceae bacterium]|nr:AAA family ATPase [Chitinispirillaceae bacterium]